ncbi:transposase [Paenibacillus sp. HB172176]|uniref:transposase n=1 Tax=Paenibacillus sp. HB172176 TaxID=2493690 RepID=UPI001F0EC897|nr:transposase [Paenibacillus sp. HB172176]
MDSLPYFIAIDHTMLKFMNEILSSFRNCFTRTASYEWFVVIVVGLMVRSDHLGVTSIIRNLALDPRHYESMLHFFRSSAWSLESLQLAWYKAVNRHAPVVRFLGRVLLVSDGMKKTKEAKYMPGVKKLHQESENSAKGEYIFGHFFGAIGVLAGPAEKWFCLPLFLNLQDGVKAIFGWDDSSEERQASHVVQVIDQAFTATGVFGRALLLLDRYYLSIPALQRLAEGNRSHASSVHLVTRAKMNAVAYEAPTAKKPGRGRPPKKGNMVKLATLFQTRAADFQTTTVTLYGKEETVSFLCTDLLWGQGLYQQLRFVLVRQGERLAIFVSTDLSLEPLQILTAYSYRFKIECTFREMKQVIGAFGYRFWSAAMPKLNRYRRKKEPDPLEDVTNEQQQKRIRLTLQAIEGFVMCSVIATGLIQLIALRFSGHKPGLFFRYLRTPSKSIVSEATVVAYFRQSIFRLFAQNSQISLTQIIRSKQKAAQQDADFLAS